MWSSMWCTVSVLACPRLRQSPTDPMPAGARTAVEKIVCAPVRCACMHVRLMPGLADAESVRGAESPAHWARRHWAPPCLRVGMGR